MAIWAAVGVNKLWALKITEWAGYERGWMSTLICFGVWFGPTALCAVASAQARGMVGKDRQSYIRQAEADRPEDEERIRQVCAKVLHEAGLYAQRAT